MLTFARALIASGFLIMLAAPAQSDAQPCAPNWSALGSGIGNGGVNAIAVFDDGSGPKIYAAGTFTQAGGSSVNRIGRWNGSQWERLPGDDFLVNATVTVMTVFDRSLCIGGSGFPSNFHGVASWNGAIWDTIPGAGDYTLALCVSGPAIYLAQFYGGVARWDGASLTHLGGLGIFTSHAPLASFDDGSGPALYATTSDTNGNMYAVQKWTGAQWATIGTFDRTVYALAAFGDGAGAALYAAGDFGQVNGVYVNHVARWNGSQWSRLGAGTDNSVEVLAAQNSGPLSGLYAGGSFYFAGNVSAQGFARWDGVQWYAPGAVPWSHGFGGIGATRYAVYIGGAFATAGGVPAAGVVRWGCSCDALCTGPATADMNGDGRADAQDIAAFVAAALSASVAPASVCPGDFDDNCAVDAADVPAFVARLLTSL